jgi:hypothetical protein
MDADRILRKWRTWLEQIEEDIVHLYEFRRIYKDTREIVSKNPAIQAPGLYHDFVASCYVAYAVMAVRRQASAPDRDSVSLTRLLDEIEKHPSIMSRQRFVAMYPEGLPRERLAGPDYNRLAGSSGNQVSPEIVRRDRNRLDLAVKRVNMLANKRVAHLDYRKPIDPLPTYVDLDKAIDTLGGVFNKYSVLLTGTAFLMMEPTIVVDWTAIFQVPWLPDASAESGIDE